MVQPNFTKVQIRKECEEIPQGISLTETENSIWIIIRNGDNIVHFQQPKTDNRATIELELTPEEELEYMRAAHQQDITFNQFVENAIRSGLDKHSEVIIDLDPL